MEKMTRTEQKKALVEMLKYFDEKCRANGIEYSMFSGSLIGAVRHNGMIPWDDDIDVIVMRKDYKRLVEVFNDENCPYMIFSSDRIDNYFYPYIKLVDTRTRIIETEMVSRIESMGLFIDIFAYSFLPENAVLRKLKYQLINTINKCMYITKPDKSLSIQKQMVRVTKNWIGKKLGYKRLLSLHERIIHTKKTSGTYVMYNWPVYGFEKDVQKEKDICGYIDKDFEGITVRIFKNYDRVLKTTFGDYLTLPPEEKRINHSIEAYRI